MIAVDESEPLRLSLAENVRKGLDATRYRFIEEDLRVLVSDADPELHQCAPVRRREAIQVVAHADAPISIVVFHLPPRGILHLFLVSLSVYCSFPFQPTRSVSSIIQSALPY